MVVRRAEVHGRRLRVGWAQKNAALTVTGLPGGVTAEQLKALFSPFGALEDVRLGQRTLACSVSAVFIRAFCVLGSLLQCTSFPSGFLLLLSKTTG
jgi:RNA recognition motif-containing protein